MNTNKWIEENEIDGDSCHMGEKFISVECASELLDNHDRLLEFVKTAASLLNESDHNSATVKMLAMDILGDL